MNTCCNGSPCYMPSTNSLVGQYQTRCVMLLLSTPSVVIVMVIARASGSCSVPTLAAKYSARRSARLRASIMMPLIFLSCLRHSFHMINPVANKSAAKMLWWWWWWWWLLLLEGWDSNGIKTAETKTPRTSTRWACMPTLTMVDVPPLGSSSWL
jgi:hypothetical protein